MPGISSGKVAGNGIGEKHGGRTRAAAVFFGKVLILYYITHLGEFFGDFLENGRIIYR